MPDKTQILQSWFDRIWTDGDVEAVSSFLSAGATSDGILPDGAVSAEEMPGLVHLMRAPLGAMAVRLVKTVEDGDWMSALLVLDSYVETNGDPIQVYGQIMARFEGDQMAEMYHSFDFLSHFEQLGQVPENALALLLTGTKLK